MIWLASDATWAAEIAVAGPDGKVFPGEASVQQYTTLGLLRSVGYITIEQVLPFDAVEGARIRATITAKGKVAYVTSKITGKPIPDPRIKPFNFVEVSA